MRRGIWIFLLAMPVISWDNPLMAQVVIRAANQPTTREVAVMGEVVRPGVYQMKSDRLLLRDVLAHAQGFTNRAVSTIQIVRNGRGGHFVSWSPDSTYELQPGDVVVVRGKPKSVRPAHGLPRAVQLALVNVLPRPVVVKVAAKDANVNRIVQMLGQKTDAEWKIRIIPSRGPKTTEIPDNSVLVFEKGSVDKSKLPQLPPPVTPSPADTKRVPAPKLQSGLPKLIVPKTGPEKSPNSADLLPELKTLAPNDSTAAPAKLPGLGPLEKPMAAAPKTVDSPQKAEPVVPVLPEPTTELPELALDDLEDAPPAESNAKNMLIGFGLVVAVVLASLLMIKFPEGMRKRKETTAAAVVETQPEPKRETKPVVAVAAEPENKPDPEPKRVVAVPNPPAKAKPAVAEKPVRIGIDGFPRKPKRQESHRDAVLAVIGDDVEVEWEAVRLQPPPQFHSVRIGKKRFDAHPVLAGPHTPIEAFRETVPEPVEEVETIALPDVPKEAPEPSPAPPPTEIGQAGIRLGLLDRVLSSVREQRAEDETPMREGA